MNSEATVTCPKCGAEMPLSEAVSTKMREQIEAEFARERKTLQAALAQREEKIAAERGELERRSNALQAEVARQIEAERQKLVQQADQQARERLSGQMQDLQNQLAEKQQRLAEAQKAELEVRKQQRELEDARQAFELEMARKLDSERRQIAETARQQASETERLKLAEKEQVIRGLQEQIAALKQRAEQGSMQIQGETLEVELENELRRFFPHDEIAEIKKGQRGADVCQRVRTNAGLDCGLILWEAKRARNWGGDWPEKLREDQREMKAQLAVIVTTCPPEGVRGFGQHEGIWVCELAFAPALGAALRQGLIGAAMQRLQDTNRADKMARVYDYLCGVEFRHHVEALVESFVGLQDQLAAEQRAFQRQWKEREQQIVKAIQHTALLYGGIQGIAGRDALPEIKTLQLPGAES